MKPKKRSAKIKKNRQKTEFQGQNHLHKTKELATIALFHSAADCRGCSIEAEVVSRCVVAASRLPRSHPHVSSPAKTNLSQFWTAAAAAPKPAVAAASLTDDTRRILHAIRFGSEAISHVIIDRWRIIITMCTAVDEFQLLSLLL